MAPCLMEQRLQILFGPVAPLRAHVLMCSLESCQERSSPTLWFVFSLLITRRERITAPRSRSPAHWGPESGNCSQGSDHRPVPLPNQSKEKPSSLVLSLPCSLARQMVSTQQHQPAFPKRHADGWKCCGQSLFFTLTDCHRSTMIAAVRQLQFNAWTGDLHTSSTASACAPHKATLTRKVTLETCKTSGRIDT